MVEYLADGVRDDIVDAARVGIERRNRRKNRRPDLGELRERAQMPEVQRRLANDEHDASTLLEAYVGGARQ